MRTVTIKDERRSLTNVAMGENVRIFDFVNAYGCTIGDNTKVGAFVEIQKNAVVGRNCKISSHTFICEGVHIDDNVFVGHNVTFINDRYPSAVTGDGSMQTEDDWNVIPTHVGKEASIGSSSTIMCGVTIGEGAMIGAGSVVTKNVPAGAIAAGNPARVMRTVDKGKKKETRRLP
ncbi:MAG: dTDP-3-amino-3,6-dideoxy-alpha-D-galactopyranose 3-N-acetyltransferase [Syntrophorhabdus sp. PtaB.Bin047]|nr:MAG: dTDP-3-amino-3,6-dideoxy-alpha-D-galactopyranose 3-N-acetyltransferase [Syntrophorhabdus sp. PtaB.Bin047]